MACCIIAAYLLALFKAKLRGWAVFVGLVRPGEWDDPDTVWHRLARRVLPPRQAAAGRRNGN